MKTEFKYELRKQGRIFRIYEVKTRSYVAQGSNRKAVASVCSNMNRGGFFNGETPTFFINNGPVEVTSEKIHTRKPTQNKSKQKTRNKRTRHNNKRRQEEYLLSFS
tara:strand:- start:313 stop:630 length:318 start_codon:yes stop_codon:yes gene_type:complete